MRNKGVKVRRLSVDYVQDLFKVRRTLELQAICTGRPLRGDQSDRMREALATTELAHERENWRRRYPQTGLSPTYRRADAQSLVR